MNNEELLADSILAKVNIKDPDQMLEKLFAITDHQQMRLFIYRMLTAAYSKDKWEDGTADKFLFNIKLLELAINIGYAMNKGRISGTYQFPYTPPPKSTLDYEPSTDFLMSNIAQMITLHECAAPNLPIQHFFEFTDLASWKVFLKDLTHHALSHEDYRNLGNPFPSLKLFTYLSKLVDSLQVVNLSLKNM